MFESANIDFLNHILGFAVILEDAPGDTKKTPIVALDDCAKRGAITRPRELHQFALAEWFHSIRLV